MSISPRCGSTGRAHVRSSFPCKDSCLAKQIRICCCCCSPPLLIDSPELPGTHRNSSAGVDTPVSSVCQETTGGFRGGRGLMSLSPRESPRPCSGAFSILHRLFWQHILERLYVRAFSLKSLALLIHLVPSPTSHILPQSCYTLPHPRRLYHHPSLTLGCNASSPVQHWT